MWLSPNNSKYKCAIFCILQIVVSKNEEYCLHFTNVEPWGSVPIDIVLSLFIIVQNYKYEWKYRMSSKGKTSFAVMRMVKVIVIVIVILQNKILL